MNRKHRVHDDGLRSKIEDEAQFWGLMDRLAKRMEDPYRQTAGRLRRAPDAPPSRRDRSGGEGAIA